MGDVHSMLAVDSDEPKGLEQRSHFADRPDIDERSARPQANFGLPSPGSKEVHVVRVEHPVLVAGDMNEDSMRCHISVVARLGSGAYWMVAHSMNWLFGERAGFLTLHRMGLVC